MIGPYESMIGTLRQLSEPRLRQQARTEKSQTPVERNIIVQRVRSVLVVQFECVCILLYRSDVSYAF